MLVRKPLVVAALAFSIAAPFTTPLARGASASGPVAVPTPRWVSAPVGGETLGLDGWQVLSTAETTADGRSVSDPTFPASGWLRVAPDDAGAPGTEIEALLQHGACPDVFYSDNMKRCFGYETHVGAEAVPRFAVPWWYRTTFSPTVRRGQVARLVVNGVVGQADLWVNGTQVAAHEDLTGAYVRSVFDISGLVRPGTNALALEVHANNPNVMYTLDNVDWGQIPPDNNTGIQFPVQLDVSDALAVSNTHVLQDNAADMSISRLTVDTDVTNPTSAYQTGDVAAAVVDPGDGAEARVVRRSVTVAPHETATVTFSPSDYPQLIMAHPKVWWPYQIGAQPLYSLTAALLKDGDAFSTTAEQFGIRTVSSSLIGPSALAPRGVRQFSVNGQPILIRGGGFAPQLFLHYSAADTAAQIRLLRSMGLNTIRLEGHLMPADFYQQMDRAGLLIDAGYQCCDAWQPKSDAALTPDDLHILYRSALRLGADLRDHPSVIDFSWSDNAPTPRQEGVSLLAFHDAGFQQPIISSAEYNSSPALGISGEKEGPYDWVPPAYWYDTSHSSHNRFDNDPTLTNVGGSWGFDSEQSAGDTVPTIDSINRFMSPEEQARLWQDPAYNQYHTNYEASYKGYAFGTLYALDTAMAARYGQWHSLSQYIEQAQVQDYEVTRSQYEAFIDHSINTPTPSTGTVYWMANKGWPTLLWDLYNSDYDQAGTYFGAQEANVGVHALYAYDTHTVTLDNLSGRSVPDLTVESKVHDLAGTVIDDQRSAGVSLSAQQVRSAVLEPDVPASTEAPTPASTYFVELVVRQRGDVIDRNVYWLSTQADVVDWPATAGRPRATMSQYADLQDLRSLPPARITVRSQSRTRADGETITTVMLRNDSTTSTVGFFLRADIRRGDPSGQPLAGDNDVLPVTWSANDTTLWPGESQTLTATYSTDLLRGAAPVVSAAGWNMATTTMGAARTPEGTAHGAGDPSARASRSRL